MRGRPATGGLFRKGFPLRKGASRPERRYKKTLWLLHAVQAPKEILFGPHGFESAGQEIRATAGSGFGRAGALIRVD
tara:strand:+ start:1098 stop:1328 length:231 start_codon:yes stop_codon:yes gene_type:complete